VKVYPRSSREEVRDETSPLKVYLRESPTEGKANEALRRVLGKHFGTPKSFVKIIRGKKSRIKLIELPDK